MNKIGKVDGSIAWLPSTALKSRIPGYWREGSGKGVHEIGGILEAVGSLLGIVWIVKRPVTGDLVVIQVAGSLLLVIRKDSDIGVGIITGVVVRGSSVVEFHFGCVVHGTSTAGLRSFSVCVWCVQKRSV